MIERALQFECQGSRLLGIVHEAQAPQKKVGVIVVVGGPQYRVGSHRQFTLMAREFAKSGYPTLRFDYRGMGDSEGESRGFEHVQDDIHAAVDALFAAVPNLEGVVLWGLCDAAAAILMYGRRRDPRLFGLIGANPWVRTASSLAQAYVSQYYWRRFLQRSFWAKIAGGGFHLGRSLYDFVVTLARARAQAHSPGGGTFIDAMLDGLQRFAGPMLILISERDLTAAEFISRCKENPQWAAAIDKPNVRIVPLANADHTFSTHAELTHAVMQCTNWLDECTRG